MNAQTRPGNYYKVIRPFADDPHADTVHIREVSGDVTIQLPDGHTFGGKAAVDYAKRAIDSGLEQMIVTVDAEDSPLGGRR